MVWGFNGVVKLPIFFAFDFGDKSRPQSLRAKVILLYRTAFYSIFSVGVVKYNSIIGYARISGHTPIQTSFAVVIPIRKRKEHS
jgi:hypothetical protein